MTSTEQRFTLDEDRAVEWLERAVSVYEGTAADDDDAENLPQITGDWQAADPGNENDIFHLVRHAVDTGIIDRPGDNYDVDFEYVDDEDGGYYYFLVRIGYQLKLASHAYEMRKIDGRDEAGVTAAIAILREAVRSANGVLGNLDEYVTSRQDTTLADEWTANGEPLPVPVDVQVDEDVDEYGIPWRDRCTSEDPCPTRAMQGGGSCDH
jgi:hypothetical protein